MSVPCLRTDSDLPWPDAWLDYADACLRQAEHSAIYAPWHTHLHLCPSCANMLDELVSLLRWREGQIPFNRDALPCPAAFDFRSFS